MRKHSFFNGRTVGWRYMLSLLLCISSAEAAANKEDMPSKRDPFTTSELMQSESGRLSNGNTPGGRGFIPNMGVGQVPKMELKGFVDGKHPMAMLEIEGVKRVFNVRKGDEIDLRIYRIPVVIQIVEVNGLSVKIRTGTINQVLVVR